MLHVFLEIWNERSLGVRMLSFDPARQLCPWGRIAPCLWDTGCCYVGAQREGSCAPSFAKVSDSLASPHGPAGPRKPPQGTATLCHLPCSAFLSAQMKRSRAGPRLKKKCCLLNQRHCLSLLSCLNSEYLANFTGNSSESNTLPIGPKLTQSLKYILNDSSAYQVDVLM